MSLEGSFFLQIVEPLAVRIEPQSGRLVGANGHYEKYIADLNGCYADSAAFERLKSRRGNDIAYAVDQYSSGTAGHDLIFGTSTLEPGTIAGEFFMTRGHLHRKADRPEIYQGVSGRGVMLMETVEGRAVAIEITAGTVVHVPPHWIHRSVNVCPDRLVTLFCYPADAGQDYEIIRSAGGMSQLVVSDGASGWKTVPNPHYQQRQARSA